MADHSVEIAALEKVLNTAASQIRTGGASVTIDLEAAKARLKVLRADDAASIRNREIRPAVSRMKLGNAF